MIADGVKYLVQTLLCICTGNAVSLQVYQVDNELWQNITNVHFC